MNYNCNYSLRLFGAVIIIFSFIATGCHNDDTTSPPAIPDTTGVATNDAQSVPDSGMVMKPDTVSQKMGMGTAKSNESKKGMKGRVMVMPAPKMTGAMEADNMGVYSNVEVYPSFPGGTKGLQDYFDKNLIYPEDASKDGAEGTVNVMFTVDENGKLSDAHTMGDKLGYGMDEEALKAVSDMPAWNPGKLKGKNVKTRFTLPVSFQLN